MGGKDQKTEQPTQRRLQKAREEGNFASARVFVSAVQFLAFTFVFCSWGNLWIAGIREAMVRLLSQALQPEISPTQIVSLGTGLVRRVFTPLAIHGAVLVAVTLAAQFLVTRMGFSLQKLAPDIKRLNPLSRLRELPRQNFSSLIQAVVMLPVFAWAVYAIVMSDLSRFLS